jgi:16S rRNA (cytosine1402-N4)-methyltransferase
MRMDQSGGETAADIINQWSAEELADLFYHYADEKQSRKIARGVEARRQLRPFTRTMDLADFIETVTPRHGQRSHPATRVFQALRMAVNDEVGSLEDGLAAAWKALKPGGRLAVITFHSLEDRTVKHFGRALCRDYEVQGEVDLPDFRTPREPQGKWLSRKPVLPAEIEIRTNPRARSAQLRALEKLKGTRHGEV